MTRQIATRMIQMLGGITVVASLLVLSGSCIVESRRAGVTLGAIRSAPVNLADIGGSEDDPIFDLDIGPDLDTPIRLPFDEAPAQPVLTPAAPAVPEGECDPLQAVRDGFKPKRLRCRMIIPSI